MTFLSCVIRHGVFFCLFFYIHFHAKYELLIKIISYSSRVFYIFLLDNMLHGSATPPWPRWPARKRELGHVDKREWEASGAPHTRLDTFPPLRVRHPYPSSSLWRPHAHTFTLAAVTEKFSSLVSVHLRGDPKFTRLQRNIPMIRIF